MSWFTTSDCSLDDFASLVSQRTDVAAYPLAADVVQNVLVYRAADLEEPSADADRRRDLQAELSRALTDGPGIAVFEGAFECATVDRATAAFRTLIEEQRRAGTSAGDHFAKPGANDRVWNALEKLAVHDPDTFVDYYANDIVNLVSVAWLGPNYQVTSQVNVVNPGGAAQSAHRDYHLGFMSAEQASAYPAHVHPLSAALTLQGAVAHTDMPVETGPTMYLPHSQKYEPGYLCFHREDFAAYFADNHVQLPLAKGDAVFFNPAIVHGAGENRSSDVRRMANLLQVSSAFGRAMETVDRRAVCRAVFGVLRARRAEGRPEQSIRNAVAAAAEGYAFPTDLDRDAPVDGLAPETQADLLWRAIDDAWPDEKLEAALGAHAARRHAAG